MAKSVRRKARTKCGRSMLSREFLPMKYHVNNSRERTHFLAQQRLKFLE